MSIARTNTNLALFCLSVVGAPYWFGTFGNKADRSLYNSKKSQYPSYYPPKSWTEASFTDDFGKRVTDCAGLIKWFLWSDNMTNKNPTYRASEDWGANTFYSKCTSKGKIGTLPANKIGILVFKGNDSSKNHVGVIVDNNGTVVEAKGHAYGTIKSKAKDWGYWGKCNLIKYEEQPTPTPTPTPTPPQDFYKVHTQTGDTLRLRKEPTTKSECLAKIPNNTTIKVSDVVEGEDIKGCKAWVKTTYNGFTGYASGKYLEPTPVVPPSPTPTPTPTPTGTKYRVKTNTGVALKIRAQPTTKSTQVGWIDNGQVVYVESISNGWGYVNRNGAKGGGAQKGYSYMQYLKKV